MVFGAFGPVVIVAESNVQTGMGYMLRNVRLAQYTPVFYGLSDFYIAIYPHCGFSPLAIL
jgi:hypothetical protein